MLKIFFVGKQMENPAKNNKRPLSDIKVIMNYNYLKLWKINEGWNSRFDEFNEEEQEILC